jgi:predicted GNAT family N-acyltransferase
MIPICKLVETSAELEEAHKIRKEVFVIEQNVPPKIEWDEYEDSATHLICKLGDKVVGTGRITFFSDKAKVERVAVPKSYRNQGIGTAIVKFQILEAKKRGVKEIYAHVQMHAKGFYSKMDFSEVGDIFYEADIEHVRMVYNED